MAYLRTVLSYQLPSEAELDKSFLESHGLTVYLMNNQTTRNELGPLFWIQLQVPDEEWPSANQILREARPERFGSVERVNEIDREIKRGALGALMGGVVLGVLAYFLAPKLWPAEVSDWALLEQSIMLACFVGAVVGWRLSGKRR
ncbi:MAG TPA: hypothetical protein VNU49_06675 [Opitutaceae bacterium]|jgi:hypothetical protein|nr:hypothetical protein [Opitutaceae bacterium]